MRLTNLALIVLIEGTIGDSSDTPDPRPSPLAAPFEQQGDDVVINCPPPE